MVSSGVRHVLSIDSPSAISVGENEVASSQLRGLGVILPPQCPTGRKEVKGQDCRLYGEHNFIFQTNLQHRIAAP